MRIRGLIFDFNGVIIDDEPLHCRGFQGALAEQDLSLSRQEYYEKFLPFDDYHFFLHFLADRREEAGEDRIRHLMGRKSEHYFEHLQAAMPVLHGSVTFLRSLPADLPVVIASGAAKSEIEYVLAKLDLRSRFDEIIAAGDVTKSKPDPEAFLKALSVLRGRLPDITTQEVVVFEDSYRGVEGALSAGFTCVGITTSYPAQRLRRAHLVIESLDGWTLEKLEEALTRGQTPRQNSGFAAL